MPAAPSTYPDASRLLDARMSIPAELRTAEWARLPQWLRERAFYMSAVARAELLDEFRREVGNIAQGSASIPEAEKRLGAFLEKSGYQPLPGQEGTIKDLRSWRRMRVALRTNVEMLQGYGQKQRGMTRGAMLAFPAWELVRIMPRRAPRDWDGRSPAPRRSRHAPGPRWLLAGGKLYNGRMIAMKDSPVWLELGSFEDGLGVDYPPFAWGSGMGWKAVSYSQADALGVIPADWSPPPETPAESPNATLQATPAIASRALRTELSRRLRGLAEWRGDTLVFTDPNGSRPMAPEQLVATWDKGMPDAFHDLTGNGLFQREALKLWIENHADFTRETDPKTGADITPPPGRLNVFDDLWRLFQRLIPMPSDAPVFRGLAWQDEAKFQQFLDDNRRVYTPIPGKPADSWSVADSGARKYARSKPFQVTLVCEKHTAAKDISALVRSLRDEIRNPDPRHPLITDGEVVFLNGAKFKVTRIVRGTITKKGGEATVYVEQL